MSTIELKSRIQAFLEHADDRVLNIVHSVLQSYYEDEVVASHPDGTPMLRSEYKSALEKAEEQIKQHDFISVEEFEEDEN